MGAPNGENTTILAQTYQFILNLVPAIISMYTASVVVKYVFRYFSVKQETRLKALIDLHVNPKIEELNGKIDLLLKMNRDGNK